MAELSILHVAHDHPDWTPGGTEIVAHDLARAMDARPGVGARLLVTATSLQRPGAAPGTLQAMGEDFVLCTGLYDRFTMLRGDGPDWIASLGRVIDAASPDVVHFHGVDRIGAEAVAAVKRHAPGCRIVMTLHDYQLICPNDGLMLTTDEGARCGAAQPDRCGRCYPGIPAARHALRQAHLLALLRPVDQFVAPSAFLRDKFVAWGLDASRIRLIPNAVATGVESCREPASRARRNRFAFFGGIARHKGVLVLLDAAARLAGGGADIGLTLHGGLGWADAAFRASFGAALAAASPLAQHLGPYDRRDTLALMRRADWIVTPSIWWENAPLVILEARAAGRPVICSGVGGMAEMVEDGVTGLHVQPGDAAALADAMAKAADDPDLWARLAGAQPAVSHQSHVAAHLDLYRGLLERVAA